MNNQQLGKVLCVFTSCAASVLLKLHPDESLQDHSSYETTNVCSSPQHKQYWQQFRANNENIKIIYYYYQKHAQKLAWTVIFLHAVGSWCTL